MKNLIKRFFKPEAKFIPKLYVLFNVQTFNDWWNDKENGATYANRGIFLRTDKLDSTHISEYLEKCHNLDQATIESYRSEIGSFYVKIRTDWHRKIRKKTSLQAKKEKQASLRKATKNDTKRKAQ